MNKESKNPLVTIGVTNFNYGRYIHETMKSILEQNYQPIEILFYDDCSTDGSNEILISSYADTVKLLQPKRNSGQGFGVNWILQEAKGEYILIIDGDDMLDTGAIAGLVDAIGDADVAFGYCSTFIENGEREGVDRHSYINREVAKIANSGSFLSMAQLMPRCNKLISMQYAKRCGLKNSCYRVMDDALFAMTLALGQPVCEFTEIPVTKIRAHEESTSNVKTEGKVKEILHVTVELYEFLKKQSFSMRLRLAGNNLVYFVRYAPGNTQYVVENRRIMGWRLRFIVSCKLALHRHVSTALKIIL